jgi:hypothetical protein
MVRDHGSPEGLRFRWVKVWGQRGHLMARDSTAVITAFILLQHGLGDDAVLRYIARRGVNERQSAAALTVAHYLVERSAGRAADTRSG